MKGAFRSVQESRRKRDVKRSNSARDGRGQHAQPDDAQDRDVKRRREQKGVGKRGRQLGCLLVPLLLFRPWAYSALLSRKELEGMKGQGMEGMEHV